MPKTFGAKELSFSFTPYIIMLHSILVRARETTVFFYYSFATEARRMASIFYDTESAYSYTRL